MFDTFWLVWCSGGGAPIHRHHTPEAAMAEAKRLAQLHQGHDFYTLQATGMARKVEVEWQDAKPYERMPF
jgi:hypothetical protein